MAGKARYALLAAVLILLTAPVKVRVAPAQSIDAQSAVTASDAGKLEEVERLLSQTPFLPFDWPMPPLTGGQLADARLCQLEGYAGGVSLSDLEDEDLLNAVVSQTPCEWAQLAAEYARRAEPDSPVTGEELQVFTRMVRENPAYLFKTEIAERYFGRVDIVKAMPLATQVVTGVALDFASGGDGGGSQSTWTFLDSGNNFTLRGVAVSSCYDCDPNPISFSGQVDSELAQNLARSLVNMVPIDRQTSEELCDGVYANGNTLLLFESNEALGVATHGTIGPDNSGLWQLEYQGRAYLQYGDEYYMALREILGAVGVVENAGLYGPDCGWYYAPLDLMFN